jgi:hypothetical protein
MWISLRSTSTNLTTYSGSVNSGATETITLNLNLNGIQTALIAGTKTTCDTITVTVLDSGLSGGQEAVTYTVLSGDTLATIASGITSAINADTNLQAIGVSATSSATLISINSLSANATSYLQSKSTNATEFVFLGINPNGVQTAVVGGSKTTGDTLTITVYDVGLTGGSKTETYTVLSGDTLTTIASGLAGVINADSALSAIGVSATSNGTVINITSSSYNATTYTQSTSSGATETISLSNTVGATQAAFNNVNELTEISAGGAIGFQGTTANPIVSAAINLNQAVTVGGTITAGDVLWVGVHDKGLSQAENLSYTVMSGDSTTSIASALTSAINSDSTLSSLGVTATVSGAVITITSKSINTTTYTTATSTGATETLALNGSQGTAATLNSSQSFSGIPTIPAGSNAASITAVSGGGTPATNNYQINVGNAGGKSLTYDSNGNMTSDGTNSYAWDAENRLIRGHLPRDE